MSIRWLVAFGAALGAMVAGVWLGEPSQVLMHAASVCLACLGIG